MATCSQRQNVGRSLHTDHGRLAITRTHFAFVSYMQAARHCVPEHQKDKDVDTEKVSAAIDAIRRQKGVSAGKDVQLTVDEFRLLMNMLSSKSDGMLAALFEALDAKGTGTVSLNKCETAIASLTAHTSSLDVNRTFVFDFFDVQGKGQITETELHSAITRLVNVALAHTNGHFLEVYFCTFYFSQFFPFPCLLDGLVRTACTWRSQKRFRGA